MDVAFGGRGGTVLGSDKESKRDEQSLQPTKKHTGFDGDQVGLLQLLSSNGVRAVLVDVLEDESPLVDMARL